MAPLSKKGRLFFLLLFSVLRKVGSLVAQRECISTAAGMTAPSGGATADGEQSYEFFWPLSLSLSLFRFLSLPESSGGGGR